MAALLTAQQIREKRATKIDAAGVLWKRQEQEGYTLSDQELADFDALIAEGDALEEEARSADARELRSARLASSVAGLASGQGRRSMPHTDPGNTRGETHSYSLLKFLRQINPGEKGDALNGLELETSQELAKRSSRQGLEVKGHLMPLDLPVHFGHAKRGAALAGREHRTALTVSTASGTIETLMELPLIEVLRNRMLWLQLGATMFTGLVGELVLPKQSASGSVTWNGETATNSTESAAAVTGLTLAPKRASAFQPYSKTLLRQSSIDVEMFVRSDLATCHALALDAAAFVGSGSAPAGALGNSSIPTIAIGTNGGAMTLAKLLEMEASIDTANALDTQIAYVTSPKGRSQLKGITKVASSTFADFLWDRDNTVNSYPAYSTTAMPANLTKGSGTNLTAGLLGDFSNGFFGLWGDGLDIVIDPYTLALSGQVRVIVEQFADFVNRRPEAFAKCVDQTTA